MPQDPKIQVDITARDKASEVIEDVADAAADLEKATPEVTVTADTDTAEADLKAVAEQAAALERADAKLVITAQIDKAKGELKELQRALGAVDDSATATGHQIGDEIEQGTGKAGGAVHSMAGNVIGDSAAMATGFGPLGEAVGQLTEGALGGEVALKGMLGAAAGMGAIALTAKAWADHNDRIAKSKAFNEEQVKAYTDALKDGLSTVEAITEVLTAAGKIEFELPGDLGVLFGRRDITQAMADAGVSVQQFARLVAGTEPQLRAWADASKAAGVEVGGIALAVLDQQGKVKAAAAQQDVFNTVFADTAIVAGEAHSELSRLNDTYDKSVDSIDHSREATKDATRQIDRFKEQTALADGAYRHLIGALDEQQAWADVNQDIKDYNENTKHSEEETRNHIRAIADYVATTTTIPESKKTEILLELNQGDVAGAEADITELTRTRDLKILLTAVASQDTIKLLRSIGRGGTGIVDESQTRSAPAAPAPAVTVNLPRGARYTDIQRALSTGTRRGGRRYGTPV